MEEKDGNPVSQVIQLLETCKSATVRILTEANLLGSVPLLHCQAMAGAG